MALVNVPIPQLDQTMESIAALAWLHNGISSWGAATRQLIGVAGPDCATKPFHHGSSQLFDALNGAGYASLEEFFDNHGYVGLFRPFTTRYEKLRNNLLQGRTYGLAKTLNIEGLELFSSRKIYCRECALLELNSLGFAYAHRTLQVIGVTNCPVHNTALGVVDHPDWGAAESKGILIANRPGSDVDQLKVSVRGMPESTTSSTKFGKWVHAAFTGALPVVPRNVWKEVIGIKLNEGSELARHKKQDDLSRHDAENVIATLTLLSAIFDSPEDYCKATADYIRASTTEIMFDQGYRMLRRRARRIKKASTSNAARMG